MNSLINPNSFKMICKIMFNPFRTSLFDVPKDWGRGAPNILGLCAVRFLLDMTCYGMVYHIQKES